LVEALPVNNGIVPGNLPTSLFNPQTPAFVPKLNHFIRRLETRKLPFQVVFDSNSDLPVTFETPKLVSPREKISPSCWKKVS